LTATSACSSKVFFAVASNSTNKLKQARQYVPLTALFNMMSMDESNEMQMKQERESKTCNLPKIIQMLYNFKTKLPVFNRYNSIISN
jgi:hypothetical protein